MVTKEISILGAGLVGSLLGIYLRQRGHKVQVFEKRSDPRSNRLAGGRSINLALSNRGLKALEEVGLKDEVSDLLIPMHGRMMHDKAGNLNVQAYGKKGEFINSVSRSGLNEILLNKAQKEGVEFYFDHKCESVDWQKGKAYFSNADSPKKTVQSDFLFGADGAFSALRSSIMFTDRFDYHQFYIPHGYKELSMPASASGEFAMEPNYLHIWPRGHFMLIALPNPDKSFTCTLFFPFEGEISFDSLDTDAKIMSFFQEYFADVVPLIPNLLDDFKQNPSSSLVTVKCYPWVKGNTALIGDAAHAIVPFYGQGMNAGFEDCYVLNQLIDKFGDDWESLLQAYQIERKADGDAIADLALNNFIEMRDKVGDPKFLLQKKIEAKLHEHFPDQWIPLYTMVTFSDLRYSDALKIGKKQEAIMKEIMQMPDIENQWEQLDFAKIVGKLYQF